MLCSELTNILALVSAICWPIQNFMRTGGRLDVCLSSQTTHEGKQMMRCPLSCLARTPGLVVTQFGSTLTVQTPLPPSPFSLPPRTHVLKRGGWIYAYLHNVESTWRGCLPFANPPRSPPLYLLHLPSTALPCPATASMTRSLAGLCQLSQAHAMISHLLSRVAIALPAFKFVFPWERGALELG